MLSSLIFSKQCYVKICQLFEAFWAIWMFSVLFRVLNELFRYVLLWYACIHDFVEPLMPLVQKDNSVNSRDLELNILLPKLLLKDVFTWYKTPGWKKKEIEKCRQEYHIENRYRFSSLHFWIMLPLLSEQRAIRQCLSFANWPWERGHNHLCRINLGNNHLSSCRLIWIVYFYPNESYTNDYAALVSKNKHAITSIVWCAPLSSSASLPLGATDVPIFLSEVEQEQRPSGNDDHETIVVELVFASVRASVHTPHMLHIVIFCGLDTAMMKSAIRNTTFCLLLVLPIF